MQLVYVMLITNLTWVVMIAAMIKTNASWTELLIVAVVVNVIGSIYPPISYYVAISINLLFFVVFLYGGISDKFNSKDT